MEVIKATLDPSDNSANPPPQSASEQQVKASVIPIHGLRIWGVLVRYMARRKAKGRARQVAAAVGNDVSDAVSGGETITASQASIEGEQEKQA